MPPRRQTRPPNRNATFAHRAANFANRVARSRTQAEFPPDILISVPSNPSRFVIVDTETNPTGDRERHSMKGTTGNRFRFALAL